MQTLNKKKIKFELVKLYYMYVNGAQLGKYNALNLSIQ